MTQAPAPRSNGLGIAGFIVSLVGLVLTVGVLCPLGLLLSFIALFRRPRGFAIAGVLIGLIGTIIPIALILVFGVAGISCLAFLTPYGATFKSIQQAQQQIEQDRNARGALPEDPDGNADIRADEDGWHRPLRYHKKSASEYELRSAGPDGIFDNQDDVAPTFGRGAGMPTTSRPE